MARLRRTTKRKTKEVETEEVDIESRIKPVSEIENGETVLIHGRSGTGKTTLASSFPKPLLLLDVDDQGTDSVKDEEGIHVLEIESFHDFQAVYWYLKKGEHEFKTLVVDTVTQANRLATIQARLDAGRDADSPMTQPLWGESKGMMESMIMDFRDLAREQGINVVFIAQSRTTSVDTEEGGMDNQIDPEVGPAVQPSVAVTLGASVNFIISTYIKEVVRQRKGTIVRRMEYHARIGPHPYYLTKLRAPKKFRIPGSVKDCTYEILQKIKKGEFKSGEEK